MMIGRPSFPVLVILGMLPAVACGETSGPGDRPTLPPIALDLANEDGLIVGGAFNSATDGFEVGAGGDTAPNDFVFVIVVTNESSPPITDVRVTDELAPRAEIAVCRGILESAPGGGANPSVGSVSGGDCSPDGLTWDIGTLSGGSTAALFFRAEALAEGSDVNRVTLSAGSALDFVLDEESFVVGEAGIRVELDLANEDGFIDANGAFQSAKEAFLVGEGGNDADSLAFVYQVTVTNQSNSTATNVRIVDEVVPSTAVACRRILATAPGGGANPSVGSVIGGAACASTGFTWNVGTLNGGAAATIFFRAEALTEGTPVNRTTLTAGTLGGPVVEEEPTAILGE